MIEHLVVQPKSIEAVTTLICVCAGQKKPAHVLGGKMSGHGCVHPCRKFDYYFSNENEKKMKEK